MEHSYRIVTKRDEAIAKKTSNKQIWSDSLYVQPKIYHADDHDIDPALIDADAIHVLKKLKDAGFLAYLVGGGVRDLLTKKSPKDFDISTSARPEQIKQIFQRNCLLIGRRFRLAHVRFGHKILEVSTFRTGENDSDLIIHDNVWGTPEEDAMRRDFTMNGLFYDPHTHTVIDYVGGWNDIHNRLLKTIGEPCNRFKQDPVRMIRLLKFSARFGFNIDSPTKAALSKCIEEILKSSPARILEEILRMLESGAAAPFFKLMVETGMLELLFPCMDHFFRGKHGKDVCILLETVDAIHGSNNKKPIHRAILTACLLFPVLEQEIQTVYLQHDKIPHFGEIAMITNTIIKEMLVSSFSNFPKRLSAEVSFILSTQYRLIPLDERRHHRSRMFHNHDFELALKFLRVRAAANHELMEAYNHWVEKTKNVQG
ncbi:MAG: polynucleotide adenylyltransferase PcnB [Parachlamydiaceae bacterium]